MATRAVFLLLCGLVLTSPCDIGSAIIDGWCSPCPVGYYGVLDVLAGACLECPDRSYSETRGASACTLCGYMETHNDDKTGCECILGYGMVSGVRGCRACPPGSYSTPSPLSGPYCRVCDPGTFSTEMASRSSSSCTSCPENETPNAARSGCQCGKGFGRVSGYRGGCSVCDGVSYLHDGVCRRCAVGETATADGRSCRCLPGHERFLNGVGCSVCIEGSYSYGGGASCRICPPGYYSREIAAVSVNSCISCPSGWTGSEDRTTCTCLPGFLMIDLGFSRSCVCPDNTYQVDGVCEPIAPTVAPAGSHGPPPTAIPPTVAPAGSHAPPPSTPAGPEDEAPDEAPDAETSSISSDPDSDVITPLETLPPTPAPTPATVCVAGEYEMSGSCTACPTGKFSSTSAAQSCTSCQAGATSTDDHTGCICRPGYRSVSGGLVCSPCLAGSYNPTAGASTCTECGEGDFSMHVAAVSPSICLPCPAGLLNIDKTRCDCMPGMRHTFPTQCECLSGYTPIVGAVVGIGGALETPLGANGALGCSPPVVTASTQKPTVVPKKVEVRTVHITVTIPQISFREFTTKAQGVYIDVFAQKVSAKPSDISIASIREIYIPSARRFFRVRRLFGANGLLVLTSITASVDVTDQVVWVVAQGNAQLDLSDKSREVYFSHIETTDPNLIRGC